MQEEKVFTIGPSTTRDLFDILQQLPAAKVAIKAYVEAKMGTLPQNGQIELNGSIELTLREMAPQTVQTAEVVEAVN